MADLAPLGWDDEWAAAFEPFGEDGLVPGRVAVQHRGAYDVLTVEGEVRARLPGRVRHEAGSPADLPAVGDWVALDRAADGEPSIRTVLPRRTKISRRAPQDPESDAVREQVVAANVDVLFVAFSIADDLDPELLERYLALAWESGARPVVLLTKADLSDDPDAIAADVARLGGEVPVVAVSARRRLGLDAIRSGLEPGVTGALVGPSGVGKSTLVNALAGADLLETGAVRDDGAGRHTTTRRELVLLPGGGLVVDNPGMRDVHLWIADEEFEEAFADIAELATRCRFSDCTHEVEPGCAVRAALENGMLSAERWRRYQALRHELADLEARLARRRSRARRRRPGAGAP